MVAPLIAGGLSSIGSFLQTPLGQMLASQGLGAAGNYLGNRFSGQGAGNQLGQQHLSAQGELLGQMRQPYNFDFGAIRDDAMRRFNQETVPGLAERFTGMGGQDSGAFGQALGSAGGDLQSRLAALQSQYGLQSRGLEQGRQNALANYLQGQQQLGQNQFQFRKNYMSDLLNQGLRGMGYAHQYQQQNDPLNMVNQQLQGTLGEQYGYRANEGAPSGMSNIAQPAGQFVGAGVRAFMGR